MTDWAIYCYGQAIVSRRRTWHSSSVKKLFDHRKEMQSGREPFSRFVLDQDTGSAMKGPGRVDIFWGTGDKAGEEAGTV